MSFATFRTPYLFGRDSEMALLEQAYNRVRRTGYGEIVLVGSAAGYGKTALVRSFLLKHPDSSTAIAKADEGFRRIPYSAVMQSLQSLLRSNEVNDLENGWSDASFSASTNVRIRQRLIDAFRASAQPSQPLIIFFDDLQWFDENSLQLLVSVAASGIQDTLLIGSYRTDGSDWFTAKYLSEIERGAARLTQILLDQLPHDTVERLISALGREELGQPAAHLIHSATAGNPFHVQLLLNHVFRTFDPSRNPDDFWRSHDRWDLHSLLSNSINLLPQATRKALELASCVGFSANSSTLADALGISRSELFDIFTPAFDAALIWRDDEVWHFSHDKVREHVKGTLLPDDVSQNHAVIAKSMLRSGTEGSDRLLAAAEQIVNAKKSILLASGSNSYLVTLMRAAQAARSLGSLDAAMRYADAGADLAWTTNAPQGYCWQFAELRVQCMVELQGSAVSDDEIERVLGLAQTPVQYARAVRIKANLLIIQGQFEESIDVALLGLRRLGIVIPRKPSKADLDVSYEATMRALRKIALSDIQLQPRLQDDQVAAAMELLATLQGSLFSDDGLKFVHVAKIVELSAEHGVCEASCYGLAWCGVLIASEYEDYTTALSLAEAAVALSEVPSFQGFRTAALVALDQVSVWLKPLSYALTKATEAFEYGKGSGDLSMACYASNHVVSDLLAMGVHLSAVKSEGHRGLVVARKTGFREVEEILLVLLAYADALDSKLYRPGAISSRTACASGSQMSPLTFWSHLFEGMAHFFHGNLIDAVGAFHEARKWKWTTPAHIHLADLHFYSALAETIQGGASANVEEDLTFLSKVAVINPTGFSNKVALIEAEIQRSNGNVAEAMRHYETSIRTAQAAGYSHELALAHERAGRLANDAGLSFAAMGHIQGAIKSYRLWGAIDKADRLQEEFKGILFPVDPLGMEFAQPIGDLPGSLMSQLLSDAVKHSGARRGLLIAITDGELLVGATAELQNGSVSTQTVNTALRDDMAPTSIVSVVRDTGRALRYGNAEIEAGNYHSDSLRGYKAKSVLCVPLTYQYNVVAVLYLENNAVSDAFTSGTEQAVVLFASASVRALRLSSRYAELSQRSSVQRDRENALSSARATLMRNTHATVLEGLATSIAQEVNQPLSAIVTNAGAGLRWLRLGPPGINEAISGLTEIERAGLRAGSFIQTLRSLAGQTSPHLLPVDIDEVIREVLKIVETELLAMQVTIESDLTFGGKVLGESVQIQQIILNLILNALDAMRHSAERTLNISSEQRGDVAVVSVADTGSGIPRDIRETIFNPFFSTKDHGLGMGLAISRTIAEVHGGNLDVGGSTPGGTIMVLSLPAGEMQK